MSQESQEKPGGNTKTPGPSNKNTQHYRWFLTIPDDNYEESQLSQHFKSFCKKFTFQLEEGKENKYLHWQCEISLNTKEYFASVKNLIGFHDAHIEPTKNYFEAKNYCSKKESRVRGPFNEKSVFIETVPPSKEWQFFLLNIFKEKPDPRTIYWFWDKEGNTGKSSFSKYCAVNHKACVFGSCAGKDIAYALPEDPKVIIFDFPRTMEDYVNYGAIEQVKNGLMFSSKYESKTKVFNTPHVVVFCNFKPELDKMSKDRWIIKEIK